MNKTFGIELIVYGVLLAGLSYLVHHLAPTIARPTLITGLAGGALCLIWGVRAVLGKCGKALPILTLIPVSYVMLSQTVLIWGGRSQEVPGRGLAAAVITVLCVLAIGMLMRVAYAGVVFEGEPAKPMKDVGVASQTTGKPTDQANAVKRA